MNNGIIERIKRKSLKRTNGCVEWTGTCDPNGYGVTTFQSQNIRVHRLVWLLYRGSIPDRKEDYHGNCICHSCDNRKCINPDHLFMGSHLDNMKDMESKNRRVSLPEELSPSAKLCREDVLKIRSFGKMGYSQRAIGRKFNISKSHVANIIHRRAWTNIEAMAERRR